MVDPSLPLRPDPIRIVLVFILAFSFFTTFSQEHRISISPAYNIPIGKLSWSYAPGLGAKVNYSHLRQKGKRKGTFMANGISLGYTALPPLADTLYYIVDKGGQGASGDGADIGIAVFTPFKMFHLDVTMDWGISLHQKIIFTPGASIGAMYGKRAALFEDGFGASDGFDEFVTWAALSPRLGLQYKFHDHFSSTVFIDYTFIIQLGQTDPQGIGYNENTGMFYNFCSTGLSLNYSF